MSEITEQRAMLAEAVEHLPGEASVRLGPSTYGTNGEREYALVIVVGPASPESEAIVDDLYDTVPEALELIPGLSLFTSKCSGHRLYADAPGSPPNMGAEWTVKVLT